MAEIEAAIEQIDQEIQHFIEIRIKDYDLDKKLNELQHLVPQNRMVRKQVKQLADRIHAGSQLAHTITHQVRTIDEQQQRASTCFSQIQHLLQLKKCVASMRTAMHSQDFQQAIECVRVYHRVRRGPEETMMSSISHDQNEMDRMEQEFRQTIQHIASVIHTMVFSTFCFLSVY